MMKKYILIFILVILNAKINAQPFVYIPDSAFRAAINYYFPGSIIGDSLNINHSGITSTLELEIGGQALNDITGIEYFTSLRYLSLANSTVSQITNYPPQLKYLIAPGNQFTTLTNLPNNLLQLDLSDNPLILLDAPDSLNTLSISKVDLLSITLPPLLHTFISNNNPQLTITNAFPSTLEHLEMATCQLNALPVLPSGLKILEVSLNPLNTFPVLTSSIRELYLDNTGITSVPSLSLYNNLKTFNISNNNIGTLPPIPDAVEMLIAMNCSLVTFPVFTPNSDNEWCWCNDNLIDSVGYIPPSMAELGLANNLITIVPAFGSGLHSINLRNNSLTSIPELPNFLVGLDVSDNPIDCLPRLPEPLYQIDITNTYITCLPNIPPNPDFNSSLPLCISVASSCPAYISLLHGSVFMDTNGNNIFDLGENALEGITIQGNPGYTTNTNISGEYLMTLDTMVNYTVYPQVIPYYNVTTIPLNVNYSTVGIIDGPHDFGFTPIPNINDLVVNIESYEPPRPGFNYKVKIDYYNKGTTTLMADLKLVLNTDVSFVSSTPVNSGSNADTISWSLGTLTPFQRGSIEVDLLMDVNAVLGNQNCISATLSPLAGDSVPSDNTYQLCEEIIGSFDPNDKAVTPEGNFSPAQVGNGDYLEYKIRFQNTGTADAINIEVRDTLSNYLDPFTFEFISSSHPNVWTLNNNALLFRFANIHLPDSNANEPESHGFVVFKIKPYPTVQLNDIIENTAAIFFDFNAPVITNTTSTVIANPVGLTELTSQNVTAYPNPAGNEIIFNTSSRGSKILIISDISGRKLFNRNFENEIYSIDLSGYSNGTYLYEIRQEGKQVNGKFMILR